MRVRGQNLDVVQTPRIRVTVALRALGLGQELGRRRRVIPETACSPGASCGSHHVGHPVGTPAYASHHPSHPHPAQPGMPSGSGPFSACPPQLTLPCCPSHCPV